jgi:hypothetical protein
MDQLINSLPALLRAAEGAAEVTTAVAVAAWNHVAGEGLRRQTAATSLQKQKLTVAVSDSVWRRQLESMSSHFLVRLNALLGQGSISFIEFRVDPKTVEKSGGHKHPAEEVPGNRPSDSQPVSLELVSAAASIRDPELRRAFLGAANSCVRRREENQQS